jgi:apolipoprotein N-acyltransferase
MMTCIQKKGPVAFPQWTFWVALLGGLASQTLSSPRWNLAIFGWITPLCWLYFGRQATLKGKWAWFMGATTCASILSSLEVIPLPMPFLALLALGNSLKYTLILMADRWLQRTRDQFWTTLFFPAVSVGVEFMSISIYGTGWLSSANAQFNFPWVAQLASITGLWGISFLMYWCGSVGIWALLQCRRRKRFIAGLLSYGLVLGLVTAWGAMRFQSNRLAQSRRVCLAGLSVPQTDLLEKLYEDYYGKPITIDTKSSLLSSAAEQIKQAEVPFVEQATPQRFPRGFKAMQQLEDSLFALSEQAARQGAQIIVWSEANALVFASDSAKFLQRARSFAQNNQVYVLMGVGLIHPGKISGGRKFLENEAIFLGPRGEVLTIFHKNNPVPLVEASEPGDGIVPAIKTSLGIVAVSICYDADFLMQMRQVGKKRADLLLLPSGDWYAIDPFHSFAAIFRGIENGHSILRQTSGGLSVLSDYRGKIEASLDYYQPGRKLWLASVPIGHVDTIYGVIGNGFAYICLLASIAFFLCMFFGGWLWPTRPKASKMD